MFGERDGEMFPTLVKIPECMLDDNLLMALQLAKKEGESTSPWKIAENRPKPI